MAKKYGKKNPTVPTNYQLQKEIAQLKANLKPETKWQENIVPSSRRPDSDNPYDVSFLGVDQGDGQHQRDGHQVRITSWYGQLLFLCPASGSGEMVRMVIYKPKNIEDDLTGHTSGTTPLTVNGQIDGDRFIVYSDKTFAMQPANGGGQNYKMITLKRKFKRSVLQVYDGSSASQVADNDIRLYVVSTQNSADTNPIVFSGYVKTYFTDV